VVVVVVVEGRRLWLKCSARVLSTRAVPRVPPPLE